MKLKGGQPRTPKKSVCNAACNMTNAAVRGQRSWAGSWQSSWTFFRDEKVWRRNRQWWGRGQVFVKADACTGICPRTCERCPCVSCPHSVSVGRLEESERATQEESYLKQRLWSEASQRVYQPSSIPDTLAPALTPAFVSTVGTAAVDCCKGPCLLLCVFALQQTNARQQYRQTRNPSSSY